MSEGLNRLIELVQLALRGLLPEDITEAEIDSYVENGGSIEAILDKKSRIKTNKD